MISANTWYKTHNSEFLAIVKTFKTWCHYLKGYKHKMLIFIINNSFCCFMDTKSLSSRQVRWAQELFQYNFQIDYHQGKSNAAAHALSKFPQKNQDEKDKLQAKNGQIFYHLQNSLTNASLARLSFLFSFLSHLN